MALDPKYMFSPNLQEFFIDPDTNLPLTEGTVSYYFDNNRASLKPVYELTGSYLAGYTFSQLPNPLELGGAGTTVNEAGADIRVYYYPYDDNGNPQNYYIVVKDSSGNTKLVRQAWPNLSSTSSGSTNFEYNFIRNATFYAWNSPTLIENVGLGSSSLTDFIIPDWTYAQDDAGQDIDIEQGTFSASDSDVPGNPVNYLIYRNNSPGGSPIGTINAFHQTYQNVKTLSDKNVAAAIWINQISGSSSAFSLSLTQDFGSGGSADVSTNIIFQPILVSGDWTLYSGSATMPSIAGKTIGTGNALICNLNMPLNIACEIYLTELRLNEGSSVTGSSEVSNDDQIKQTNYIGLYPAWTTGDVKSTIKTVSDPGWLMMDDTTIGKVGSSSSHTGLSYFPLYSLIWNNINNNFYAPIFTSGGALSTYGANSAADWNALKRLSLTKILGRSLAGANAPGSVNIPFYYGYSGSGNTLTLSTSFLTTDNIYTGTSIIFAAGAPTGITPNIQYFAINTGPSTFQVATTRANAIAGTAVALSGSVSTNQVVVVTTLAGALGAFAGENNHLQLPGTELAAHSHTSGSLSSNLSYLDRYTENLATGVNAYTPNITATPSPIAVNTGSTANTGGTTPFNVTNPLTYMNFMIKL